MQAEASKRLCISLIIPTYNRSNLLKTCLESAYKQSLTQDEYEVIVIDDGSVDETAEVLAALQKKHSNFYFARQKHQGPGSARNLGVKMANAPILVSTDSDCELGSDFLKDIIAFFKKYPDVSALSGDGAPKFSNGILLPLNNYFFRSKKNAQDVFVYDRLSPFFRLRTDACAVRKKVFEASGGFDKRYSYSLGEDIELGYRLLKKGYKTAQTGILVAHRQRCSLKELFMRQVRFAWHDAMHFKHYFSKTFAVEFRDFLPRCSFYLVNMPFGFSFEITFFKLLVMLLIIILSKVVSLSVGLGILIVFFIFAAFKLKSLKLLIPFMLYKIITQSGRLCGQLRASFKQRVFYL